MRRARLSSAARCFETSHRARATRRRSWHCLLKSIRHDRALSFGMQCDRASLTRGVNFILAHRQLAAHLRDSAPQGMILRYPTSVHCVRSILTYRDDFRRTLRIKRREAQSTPLFKRAFYSHVSRGLSTHAAAP